MPIAVTGATGQLGRLIINELLGRTDASALIAVVRSPEKAADLEAQGVAVRRGDYGDRDGLVAAFEGVDALMFISNTDFEKRAAEHRNVVEAARAADVGRLVYTSVFNVDHDNMLAQTHLATEQAIAASGTPYTFLRNNFYMDMYAVEVEIAMRRGAYRSPSGDAGAALVTRRDIARAAAVVLTSDGHDGQAYDMTGPEPVTPAVFAETAAALSGEPVAVEPIGWEQLAEDYRARGMPEEVVGLGVMVERLVASGAFAGVSDDIERLTGEPPEDLLSYCRKTLEST